MENILPLTGDYTKDFSAIELRFERLEVHQLRTLEKFDEIDARFDRIEGLIATILETVLETVGPALERIENKLDEQSLEIRLHRRILLRLVEKQPNFFQTSEQDIQTLSVREE